MYSQLLLNRLTKWSIKHDKLIDNQYGFQKGKSTTDCIFILHSLIYKSFKDRKTLLFLNYIIQHINTDIDGVHLFKNNIWNKTQKRIASHAASSLHNLLITFNQLDLKTLFFYICDSLISHILNYTSCVWGYCNQKKLQQFTQNSAEKSSMVRKSINGWWWSQYQRRYVWQGLYQDGGIIQGSMSPGLCTHYVNHC